MDGGLGWRGEESGEGALLGKRPRITDTAELPPPVEAALRDADSRERFVSDQPPRYHKTCQWYRTMRIGNAGRGGGTPQSADEISPWPLRLLPQGR